MDYYIYMIRCQDNSLYTGITTDIKRRYEEHKNGTGAKYTKAKKVLQLEIFFRCEGRSNASKVECFIKGLSKVKKEYYLNEIKDFKKLIQRELGIKIDVQKFF